MKTYIVAEVATTWEGELKYFEELALGVKQAGADAIKTQWCSDPEKMAGRRRVAPGQYQYLAWPWKWHSALADIATHHGLDYLCSVFVPEDIPLIAPYVARFKVASLEAEDMELLQACRICPLRPIFISTGAMTYDEVEALRRRCMQRILNPVRLLLCTSAYRCPLEDAHLWAFDDLTYTGFSDHTGDELTGAVAVARGAEIIETHVRGRHIRPDNPDLLVSLSHGEFMRYVANIRRTEQLLGDVRYKTTITPGEQDCRLHRVVRATPITKEAQTT